VRDCAGAAAIGRGLSEQAIRIVASTTAGGQPDSLARMIGQKRSRVITDAGLRPK